MHSKVSSLSKYDDNMSRDEAINLNESINLKFMSVPSTNFMKDMYFSFICGSSETRPEKHVAISLIKRCESYPLKL